MSEREYLSARSAREQGYIEKSLVGALRGKAISANANRAFKQTWVGPGGRTAIGDDARNHIAQRQGDLIARANSGQRSARKGTVRESRGLLLEGHRRQVKASDDLYNKETARRVKAADRQRYAGTFFENWD